MRGGVDWVVTELYRSSSKQSLITVRWSVGCGFELGSRSAEHFCIVVGCARALGFVYLSKWFRSKG